MPKKQKFFSKKTAIIAGVVLFALIVPNFCHALFGIDGESIAQSIMAWVTHIILSFFSLFVDLAARFLEAMLNIGFASHKDVVEIGWKIVRDFSNMFFILFMVIIAFATILRIERYGIKELLPKVIIIALLINFSLVICYLIIDFSDIAAHYFINSAKQGLSGQQSIATVLRDGLNLTKVIIPADCDNQYQESLKTCALFPNPIDIAACAAAASTALNTCKTEQDNLAKTTNQEGNFINMVISTIFGSIILMIAAFILFVGGILIVVRLFFLWFLVMLVPFVFLCYLMPALRGNWQKWWRSFLSWCFFAPIYCFFIWLAIKLILEKRINQTIGVTGDAGNQTLGTAFFGTTDNLIAYLFTAALLIGGLIAAKQMGIYGANTAMAIGQKWGRAAASRVTRYPREVGTLVSGAVAREMGKGLQKIPGFRGFGRGLEQRGVLLQRRALESKQMKDFEKLVDLMSSKQKEAEIRGGISPARSTKAALSAMRAGELEKMSTETQRIAERMFRAYGFRKESEDLIAKNPAIIENKGDREEAVKEDTEKGNHKNYREKAFEGTEGQEIADYMIQSQVTAGDAAKTLKEMRKDTQAMALKANRASFNNNFTDANEIRRRSVEAIMTGKIDVAFTDTRTGMVNEPALKAFVKKIQPEHFRDIDPASIPAIAKYVDTSAAVEMGRYISGEKKKKFADEFNTRTQDQKDILKKAPGWASYIT